LQGIFSFTSFHDRITPLPLASVAGDHYFSPVNAHSRVDSRDHKRIADVAEASPQIPGDVDPVSHRDTASEMHITISEAGIGSKCFFRPLKKDPDPFSCDPLNLRTS
jgi:hypothetical protein